MRDHHILTEVAGFDVNVIKLLPALIIGDEEVEMIVSAFDAVMVEASELRGRVWTQSAQLIRHALGR